MDGALQGLVNGLTNAIDNQGSTAVPSVLADWYEEGRSRQEWLRRDRCVAALKSEHGPLALNLLPLFYHRSNRTGRTEMTSLATKWANLQSLDFVSIKNRLGV